MSRKSDFLVRCQLTRAGIRTDSDSLEAMDSPRRTLVWSRTHGVCMAPSMQAINQHSIDHMEKSINQTLSGSKKNLRQALIEAQNPDVIVDTSDVSYYR